MSIIWTLKMLFLVAITTGLNVVLLHPLQMWRREEEEEEGVERLELKIGGGGAVFSRFVFHLAADWTWTPAS